ncbi:MAG: 4-hydroxythreonine-4-phosphate dehydrogenase PdxA [Alistipes sp.]|nr:4-hydroxythreonine-4-phosphate dehydrogenase PdxA [Alistipes sp.]
MSDNRIKIGITQGDTNGIGWEVILGALANPMVVELCTPVVYGNRKAAEFYLQLVGRDEELEPLRFYYCTSAAEARYGMVNFVEVGDKQLAVEPGKATEASAKAAMAALDAAAADLESGSLAAVVTAPINKESINAAGFGFTGHTEYFADKAQGRATMIMCSDILRVALATVHIPVQSVAQSLTKEALVEQLVALRATLKSDFGIVEPRIAVLSLNPHAGDGGLLGTEESEVIAPAINEAYEQGVLAFGPLAADGLFASGGYKRYDAILAMYHDQGLTPFKTLSPDGVNFTAGLDWVRTSPDHGVAYDIAGKGVADAQSMRNAIYAAIDIVRRREAYARWSSRPLERFEREKGRDVSISLKDIKEEE